MTEYDASTDMTNESQQDEGKQFHLPEDVEKRFQELEKKEEEAKSDNPSYAASIASGEGHIEQVNSADSQHEISVCFEAAIKKIDKVESDANKKKSEIIQELAHDLEGKMPTDEIAAEIVHQLRGRISERRIYECLEGEQYAKYKKKHRVENARKRQGRKDQAQLAAEPQLKEEVAVHASGQETVLKPAHSPEENPVKTQGGGRNYIETSSAHDKSYSRFDNSELSEEEKERKSHRKCKNCEILQQKYELLQSKLQGYEEVVRTHTSIKSAKELYRSTDGYQQFEFSVPFEPLREHIIAAFKSNRSVNRVWFTGKFNHKTGVVFDGRIGKITDTDITEVERESKTSVVLKG